ncbi:Uncharacterised protein [uncultured archaeon]|nr:Uncharacterised protein [uncultured archaeon]
MSSSLRAPTPLEYTTILAVVLVIGLIVVGLAMFFSQSSGDVTQTEAQTYWASQAYPLRVSAMQGYYYSAVPTSGEIALSIENVDSKPITLTGLVLEPYSDTGESFAAYTNHSASGASGTYWGSSTPASPLWSNSITLVPNQRMSIYLRANTLCSTAGTASASTERFKNYLTIYYQTQDFSGLSFRGIKPIMGRCNPS